jgi:putative transposase
VAGPQNENATARDGLQQAASDPGAAAHAEREFLTDVFDRASALRKGRARRYARALQELSASFERGEKASLAISRAAGALGCRQRTIYRLLARVAGVPHNDWQFALVDHRCGHDVPIRADHIPVFDRFKALYLSRARRTFAQSWRLAIEAVTKLPAHEAIADPAWRGKIPSLKSCRRRLKREVPRAAIVLARKGEDALEREYPHQTRDHSVFRAMQAVNADGRRAKCYVRWPDGTVSRPVIFSIQDVMSSRRVAWRIDKSENKEAIRLAVGDMARNFGLPDHFYIDNTHAMANKWLTGRTSFRHRFQVRDEDPEGILVSLKIRVHFTKVRHGQSKPVERQHRNDIAELDRHPALAGAMAEKGAVPVEKFIEIMDQVFAAENARVGRKGRGMNGRSYDEVFAESYAQGPIRKATEAQLRMCMLAAESVHVAANGEFTFMDNRYFGGAFPTVAGKRAIVRFDPARLHEGVHVYQLDSAYLGHAACLRAEGFNDAAAAREMALRRRHWIKAQKQILHAERRMSEVAVAEELRGRAAMKAAPPTRLVLMLDEPGWARETRKRPPIEHADRAEVEQLFSEIEPEIARRAAHYDEADDIDRAIDEYNDLRRRRGSWSAAEAARVAELETLPEIIVLRRRRQRAPEPSARAAATEGVA